MKKIPSTAIEAGMVLAKPVKSPSGNILLNEGVTLKAGMASRLQSWGIPAVFIEGDSEPGEEGHAAQRKDPGEIQSELFERFADVQESANMRKLMDITMDYLIHKGE